MLTVMLKARVLRQKESRFIAALALSFEFPVHPEALFGAFAEPGFKNVVEKL